MERTNVCGWINKEENTSMNRKQLMKQRQIKTLKRRLAITFIILSVIIGGTAACSGFLLGSHIYKNAKAEKVNENQKYYTSIEIKKGDSLWSIAQAHMSNEYDSVQEYINELKEINALDSDCINEAEYLTVAYYL